MLVAVVGYGVPRILGTGGSQARAAGCRPAAISHQPSLTASRIASKVIGTGLEWLVGAGTVDVRGFQTPTAAWSDAFPIPGGPAPTSANAGYEIRWWSPRGEHRGADVFVFRDAGGAARYVQEASSAKCHRRGIAGSASQPSDARTLLWSNPLGALQSDLFFARGDLAFRVVHVVRGDGTQPVRSEAPKLAVAAEQLACRIKLAGC
jgi:hypothetical protein